MDTLKRIIKQALKTICPRCRGTRRNIIGNRCDDCHGTGEQAYDPHIKTVRKIMQT